MKMNYNNRVFRGRSNSVSDEVGNEQSNSGSEYPLLTPSAYLLSL